MKKWSFILAVLFVPMIIFGALEVANQKQSPSSYEAFAKSDMPKIIKFGSAMCLDCKKQKEIFTTVKPKYEQKVTFIEYDAQSKSPEVQKLIKKYNVTVVPTTVFLDKQGKEIRKIEGLIPQDDLENYINEM